jgi:PAS domain S-box-containing protein
LGRALPPGADDPENELDVFRTHGVPVIVFLILFILTSTFFAWQYAKKAVNRQAYTKFEKEAEEARLLIADRIDSYINILYGMQALFAASEKVERDEWRAFIQTHNLPSRYPGISALHYLERVPRRGKEAFVQSVRTDTSLSPEGLPQFNIYPPEDRDEHYVVKYVEPYASHEKMLGFDAASDPSHLEALAEARDSGRPAITQHMHVVADLGPRIAFSMYLPVYRTGMPHETAEERREALEGFVASLFRAEDFLSGVFAKKSVHPEIGFQIYDGETYSKEHLIYDDESVLHAIYPSYRPRFSMQQKITVANRVWTLQLTALPKFGLTQAEERLPYVVLTGGVIFSLLIFAVLYSFSTARSQAISIAEGMTLKLRESEHLYSDLVEGAPDPIITLDRLGHLKSMNPAAERVSGYAAEDLLGKYFANVNVLTPASLTKALKEFALVVLGRERPPVELDIIRKDGTRITMEANPRPIKRDNQTRAIQVIFRDVTERKRTEQALREFSNYLDKIINSAADPIFVKDRKHRWVLVNDAFCHFLGYGRDEILGRSERDLFFKMEKDTFWEREEAVFESGRESLNEDPFTDAHGVVRVAVTRAALYTDAKGDKFLVGVIRDITELKRTEEKIRQLNDDLKDRNEELSAINKELEAFSYSVSHDLRAPLRAVNGFANALLEDYKGKLDADGKRFLDLIKTNAANMGQLIDDLLAFSRLGRKPIDRSHVNMGDLVQEVFKGISQSHPSRQIRLAVGPLHPVKADLGLIRQVWINLLSNAVKFTASRKEALIEVESSREGNETVYYVRDNGVGFDMRYADKLYGVFQRLHSAEEFEGTGVGLAIVQRIVHRHGGRVWAEGKVGEGATFYFSLPAA